MKSIPYPPRWKPQLIVKESSWMTTMHTSYGRYRWLRLPFGITSAPEEFQMRLTTALEGLEGIKCIADDILVYGEGNDYEEAEKDLDRRFIALMERCHKPNIKMQQSFSSSSTNSNSWAPLYQIKE